MLLTGAFQVVQILLQSRFVELCQEMRRNRGIEPADIVDQLTFIHKAITFKNDGRKRGISRFPLESVRFAF
jgi:hypothetical protein